MIGEEFNPGSAGGGMNVEVWFPQPNQVTVFLESSIPDAEEEQFYETSLFALFAARQIANLRADGVSLAFVLQTTDTAHPLAQTRERLDEVRVGSPVSTSGGRKGFTAQLRPDRRAYFKLNGHGFGVLGRGVAYYAPTSTLALLYWLLDRRKDDPTYQRALAATAENIGILGMQGRITIASQAPLAMQATAAAWGEAAEQADALQEFSLTEDARTACVDHDIDFPALVADASARLHESLSELEGEGGVALPDRYVEIVCRLEVLAAVDLSDDDRVLRAYNAVEAADATEDEAMIDAANAHYNKTLAEIVDENDLEPVVDALRAELFTRDPDAAAGA